jgi:hypothetical protein
MPRGTEKATFPTHRDLQAARREGGRHRTADADGVTPLHLAAAAGEKEAVMFCSAMGQLRRQGQGGKTPVDYAIEAEEPEIAELLKKAARFDACTCSNYCVSFTC